MYIGLGVVILIVLIAVLIIFIRRRSARKTSDLQFRLERRRR
jgi:hypothetical protein